MGTYSLRRQVFYAAALYFLLLLVVPRAGHVGDVDCWVRWGRYIFEHGLADVYQVPDNTYNPLWHYGLWLFGKLMGSTAKIEHYRHWLKALPLAFDFAGAFWAASLVPGRARRFGLALLLLLNLGYLYNSLVWVQIDAIYTFFAFGAVVLAARGRAELSLLSYVLALATKTQAIIFLPPLLLLWAPLWWRQPMRLVRGLAAGAALAVLLLAPFVWGGFQNDLPRIVEFNLGVTQVFQVVSANAYNLWCLLLPREQVFTTADTVPFAGLTYHAWGLLLFCGFSALALLPLLVRAAHLVRGAPVRLAADSAAARAGSDDLARVLLGCGLIPLLFFFFNTQMHERYGHAAVLFLAAYGFLRRDYLPYALVSAAYFLNLEAVLHSLDLLNYRVLLFQPWFVAALFGLTVGLSLGKLYRLTPWRAEWQLIRGRVGARALAPEAAPVAARP